MITQELIKIQKLRYKMINFRNEELKQFTFSPSFGQQKPLYFLNALIILIINRNKNLPSTGFQESKIVLPINVRI